MRRVLLSLILVLGLAAPITAEAQPDELSPHGFMAGDSQGGAPVSLCGIMNGRAVIITGSGSGSPPLLRLYVGYTSFVEATQWMAYDPAFTGGFSVTCKLILHWPVDHLFVVTGAGAGGGPHVRLWRVDFSSYGPVVQLLAEWMAYDIAFSGGVWVDVTYVYPFLFVATGAGPGGGPHVRLWYVSLP